MTIDLLVSTTVLLFVLWLFTFPLGRRLVIKERYHIPAEVEELKKLRSRDWIFPSFATAYTICIAFVLPMWKFHPVFESSVMMAFFSVCALLFLLTTWNLLMRDSLLPSDVYRIICEAGLGMEKERKEKFLILFTKDHRALNWSPDRWYENYSLVMQLRDFLERSLGKTSARKMSSHLYEDIHGKLLFFKSVLGDDLLKARASTNDAERISAIEATFIFLQSPKDMDSSDWKGLLEQIESLHEDGAVRGEIDYLSPAVKSAVDAYLIGRNQKECAAV